MQIKSYGKTNLPKIGEGPWFGLEIEVEARDGSPYDIAYLFGQEFEEDVEVEAKRDCSLSNGVEFAFAPMGESELRSVFKRISKLQRPFIRAYGSGDGSRRGLHIHVDNGFYTQAAIDAWRTQHRLRRVVGGRKDNRYIMPQYPRGALCQRDKTLELRFPRSEMREDRLNKLLDNIIIMKQITDVEPLAMAHVKEFNLTERQKQYVLNHQ
jgi:hypothetical protein